MKISKTLLTLSISASIAISAMAENVKLDEITVSSTAFDSLVNSISSEELEDRQASDMKDILKTLPSVTVDGNARYGQKIYVRGLQDKFSNITIDGAKMMGGVIFHHAGDQVVDATVLKVSSIELGPNSALSGAGVVNGSFKYETKDPSDFLREGETFGGKVSVGYETARERTKGSIAVFSKINDKIEFVGMGSFTNDGTLHLGNGAKIVNKESDLKSGLAKLVFKPNDENTFKLSYNKYEDGGNRAIAGEKVGSTTNTDEAYSSISRETISLNYKYNPTNNDLINLKTNVYTNKQWMTYNAHTEDRTDRAPMSPTVTWNLPTSEYINQNYGYDLRNTSVIGNHLFTIGTDFNEESQELKASGPLHIVETNTNKTFSRKGGKVSTTGIYLEDEVRIDDLTITAGARYDKFKLGRVFTGSFSQLSPKLKLKYEATDKLTFRSGYGKIFKGPDLGETLFLDNTPNQGTNTKPQTGHNIEVGVDYSLSEALNADSAIVSFNAFKYNLDNYIRPSNTSLSAEGDIKIWGLETMVSYKKDKLSLNGSHTYTGGEFTNTNGLTYDPQTAKVHVFKLGVNYQLTNELKVNYLAEFVPGNKYTTENRSRDRNAPPLVETSRSAYSTHDINFTYKPTRFKDTTFNVGIENLFDKAYRRHTAFSDTHEIGRNFKFQASYRF